MICTWGTSGMFLDMPEFDDIIRPMVQQFLHWCHQDCQQTVTAHYSRDWHAVTSFLMQRLNNVKRGTTVCYTDNVLAVFWTIKIAFLQTSCYNFTAQHSWPQQCVSVCMCTISMSDMAQTGHPTTELWSLKSQNSCSDICTLTHHNTTDKLSLTKIILIIELKFFWNVSSHLSSSIRNATQVIRIT
jgi:hypothetical protein